MLRIKIDGKTYENFSNVSIELNYDTIASTFSFDAYFDPNNVEHRKLFKPLSYHTVQIFEDSTLLITGFILSHKFTATTSTQLVPVSGYSKTGILGDVSIPTDLYPLESLNLSLYDVCLKMCKKFGLSLVLDDDVVEDATRLYDKTSSDGKGSVADYLIAMACQRNIILTHTAGGALRLTRPRKDGAAVATYTEGMPSLQFGIEFNGQGMHSVLEVIRQGTVGSDINGSGVSKNPLILQYRPLTKEQTKGGAGDTEKASENAIASELKNIILTIDSDRWKWTDGRTTNIIRPNNFITVKAPSCFLTKPSTWFVRSVTLTEDGAGRRSILTCVMPETFNEKTPTNIFS